MKICKKHGQLNESNSYKEKCYKKNDGTMRIRCKECKEEKDEKYRQSHKKELVEKNIVYKKKNREIVNKWNRQDRKNNPEKYKKYEENYIKKHGIEKIRKYEIARIHGLTVEQYDELMNKYDNKCAACGNAETRIGRDGKTITPLCIDHCHTCEENGKYVIRSVLCHACNSSLGKLKDNIETIKNLISILEKHEHVT